MTVTNHVGAALDVVKTLPDSSVDLVATSPPFLALRNYNDVEGQWGSEPSPAAFLSNLLELTTELRRVLTPHGSIAFELGDSYSGSGGGGGDYLPGGMRDGQNSFTGSANAAREANAEHSRQKQVHKDQWPLPKSLTGVPTLFAWSLAYGWNMLNPAHEFDRWRIRNLISWTRNNPPVGALGDKVRPATSYITVATISGKRWFDLDAVREVKERRPSRGTEMRSGRTLPDGTRGSGFDDDGKHWEPEVGGPPLDHWHDEYDGDTEWLINTAGTSLAHYAVWPAKLAERLILSMCPPGGTVLDPFAGTGTTLAVADMHGRDAIGIDLDPTNQALHQPRYDECKRALFDVKPPIAGQGDLFDRQHGNEQS